MSAGLVACALGAWLAGHGVLAWCRPRRPRAGLERAATATVAGLALLSAASTTAVAVFGPLGTRGAWALLLVLAAPGLAMLVARRPAVPGARRAPVERWSVLQAVAAAGALAFAAFVVFASMTMPVHVFDAVFHYGYKGALIFYEGLGTPAWTDLDGAVGRIQTHPGYPPGLPALEALVSSLNGAFDLDAARPLAALFALAPAAWLACALRSRGRWPALVAALMWLGLPLLFYSRLPHAEPLRAALGLVRAPAELGIDGWRRVEGWTLDATADLPLAALVLGACLHLGRLLPGRGGDRADLVAAGILLGGALLMKNEGTVLAAVLLAAAAVVGAARCVRAPRELGALAARLAGVAALALGMAAAWLVVRGAIPAVDEDYPARLLASGPDVARAGDVARRFLAAFVDVLRWNLLWPLFFAAVAHGLRRRALVGDALLAALVVAGALAVYFAVLTVTPWTLAELESRGIPDRLFLHVAPLAVLAATSAMWPREAPARP